eukprot:18310-Heterococcus_DN1.PRE.2
MSRAQYYSITALTDREKIPDSVRNWEEKTTIADTLCWQVVAEEWAALQEGKDPKEERAPPCKPPLKEDGTVDLTQYIAESWSFNVVLFSALAQYSDPAKGAETAA